MRRVVDGREDRRRVHDAVDQIREALGLEHVVELRGQLLVVRRAVAEAQFFIHAEQAARAVRADGERRDHLAHRRRLEHAPRELAERRRLLRQTLAREGVDGAHEALEARRVEALLFTVLGRVDPRRRELLVGDLFPICAALGPVEHGVGRRNLLVKLRELGSRLHGEVVVDLEFEDVGVYYREQEPACCSAAHACQKRAASTYAYRAVMLQPEL